MKTYPTRSFLLPTLFAAAAALTPHGADGDLDPAAAARQTGPHHQVLSDLAGDFELVSTFWFEPGAAPEVSRLPARRELILDGRVLRLEVGPDDRGFVGTGLMGFDNQESRYWYTWTDTSTTGLSLLHGDLDAFGAGRLAGDTPTPFGRAPLEVEVRHEAGGEIHDYYRTGGDGADRWRVLELRYRRLKDR